MTRNWRRRRGGAGYSAPRRGRHGGVLAPVLILTLCVLGVFLLTHPEILKVPGSVIVPLPDQQPPTTQTSTIYEEIRVRYGNKYDGYEGLIKRTASGGFDTRDADAAMAGQPPSAPTQSSQASATETPASFIPTYQSPADYTTEEKAQEVLKYVNQVRASEGRNPLQFDRRVYNIALARVNDMDQYNYMDHTNPFTGTCADSIKYQFGLSSGEYVAENAYGFASGGFYSDGIERKAVDSWMTSRGHRYNLLYPHHAGAVVCSSGGHCVFLGLNNDRFGEGCHTGTQGQSYWDTVGNQPYEA